MPETALALVPLKTPYIVASYFVPFLLKDNEFDPNLPLELSITPDPFIVLLAVVPAKSNFCEVEFCRKPYGKLLGP